MTVISAQETWSYTRGARRTYAMHSAYHYTHHSDSDGPFNLCRGSIQYVQLEHCQCLIEVYRQHKVNETKASHFSREMDKDWTHIDRLTSAYFEYTLYFLFYLSHCVGIELKWVWKWESGDMGVGIVNVSGHNKLSCCILLSYLSLSTVKSTDSSLMQNFTQQLYVFQLWIIDQFKLITHYICLIFYFNALLCFISFENGNGPKWGWLLWESDGNGSGNGNGLNGNCCRDWESKRHVRTPLPRTEYQ